jgi:hypothetical protein
LLSICFSGQLYLFLFMPVIWVTEGDDVSERKQSVKVDSIGRDSNCDRFAVSTGAWRWITENISAPRKRQTERSRSIYKILRPRRNSWWYTKRPRPPSGVQDRASLTRNSGIPMAFS